MLVPCLFIDNELCIVDVYNIISQEKLYDLITKNYYVNAYVKCIPEFEIL